MADDNKIFHVAIFILFFVKKKKERERKDSTQAGLSASPPGRLPICFAYEHLSNPNKKHHFIFGNERKKKANCKKVFFFFTVFHFDTFSHVLHKILFFSFFSFLLLECSQVVVVGGWGRGGRETEAHNRNRPTSAFITAYRSGSGEVGLGSGGRVQWSEVRTKMKEKK